VCKDFGFDVCLDKRVVAKISQRTGDMQKFNNGKIKKWRSVSKFLGSKIVTKRSAAETLQKE
jgi:hypothetical protein